MESTKLGNIERLLAWSNSELGTGCSLGLIANTNIGPIVDGLRYVAEPCELGGLAVDVASAKTPLSLRLDVVLHRLQPCGIHLVGLVLLCALLLAGPFLESLQCSLPVVNNMRCRHLFKGLLLVTRTSLGAVASLRI